MAEPNIAALTTMTGKVTVTNLTTTSQTAVLNNAGSNNKVLKVNLVRIVNVDGSAASTCTISYHNATSAGGTATELVQLKSVNNNDFFDVITKDSPIYLEENGSTGTSLSATAGGANDFKVIVSYEEIS